MLQISAGQLTAVCDQTLSDLPRECCGILVGHRLSGRTMVDRVVAAANVAADPLAGYEIASEAVLEQLLKARSGGREVVGYYHSHPDGRSTPSRRDLAMAWPRASYLIVSTADGAVSERRSWVLGSSGEFEEQALRIGETVPQAVRRSRAKKTR